MQQKSELSRWALIYFYCFAPPLCHLLHRGYTRSPDLNVWEEWSVCKHTQRHTLRETHSEETASSKDITVDDDMWNVSSKQLPALLFFGGVAREKIYLSQTVQIPECSSTQRKKSRTQNQRDVSQSFQFSPLCLEIPHVSKVALAPQIHKLNINLNSAQLICPLP